MKISKKHKAFSMIELLIVMAIVGIMSVVAYAGLTSGRSGARVKDAQREVAAAIRLAQGYALQGRTQENLLVPGAFETPCGYGIAFDNDSTTYHIFYNPLDLGTYNSCEAQNAVRQERRNKNPSENAEDYALKNGVTLSSPNWNQATVFFTVPRGQIFDRSGDEYSPGSFETWDFSLSGLTKSISINAGGYLTESP